MAKTVRPAAEREIFDLRQQIDKHNYQYYVLDDPAISDADSRMNMSAFYANFFT